MHVTTDGTLQSFTIAGFQQVQDALVFLHQDILSRVGNFEIYYAHPRFGCQCVVNPKQARIFCTFYEGRVKLHIQS